jgi:hypothetical protein
MSIAGDRIEEEHIKKNHANGEMKWEING